MPVRLLMLFELFLRKIVWGMSDYLYEGCLSKSTDHLKDWRSLETDMDWSELLQFLVCYLLCYIVHILQIRPIFKTNKNVYEVMFFDMLKYVHSESVYIKLKHKCQKNFLETK